MFQDTLDKEKLAAVVADCLIKVYLSNKDVQRWVRAIAKAVIEIENNPFMSWHEQEKHLVIWSQTSGTTYTANGTCQCPAYQKVTPCYHRAAARIMQRYYEI